MVQPAGQAFKKGEVGGQWRVRRTHDKHKKRGITEQSWLVCVQMFKTLQT